MIRLAENEEDLWSAILDQWKYWWGFGYAIYLDTLGDGVFSIDKDKRIIQVFLKDGTYDIPKRLDRLDLAVHNDTVRIVARKMGKSAFSGDFYKDTVLHEPRGKMFK